MIAPLLSGKVVMICVVIQMISGHVFFFVVVAGLVWFEVVCFDFVLSQTGSHYTILTVTM